MIFELAGEEPGSFVLDELGLVVAAELDAGPVSIVLDELGAVVGPIDAGTATAEVVTV